MHRKCDTRLDKVQTFSMLLCYKKNSLKFDSFLHHFPISSFVFIFCPMTAGLCIIQANAEIPYVLCNLLS
jgi:hypothetical protein